MGFVGNLALTLVIAVVASNTLLLIFQQFNSQVKLLLLLAVLPLLYCLGKTFHLSSLTMILVFGPVIVKMKLFFLGKIQVILELKKMA